MGESEGVVVIKVKKLSPAQRRVVEKMKSGYWLKWNRLGYHETWHLTPYRKDNDPTRHAYLRIDVSNATARVLLERGMIKRGPSCIAILTQGDATESIPK